MANKYVGGILTKKIFQIQMKITAYRELNHRLAKMGTNSNVQCWEGMKKLADSYSASESVNRFYSTFQRVIYK